MTRSCPNIPENLACGVDSQLRSLEQWEAVVADLQTSRIVVSSKIEIQIQDNHVSGALALLWTTDDLPSSSGVACAPRW